MALYGVKALSNGFKREIGRSSLTNCLLRMGTGPEYHGTTFLSTRIIAQINPFLNGVPWGTFTVKFNSMLNHTLKCKSLIRTKRRIVAKSCICIFIFLVNFGIEWYLILINHPFSRNVSLKMLRLAPELKRHTCGCNWLKLILIWASTLYVGFEKSAICGGFNPKKAFLDKLSWQWRSNTNISAAALSRNEKKEKPVDRNDYLGSSVVGSLDFRIPAWTLHAKLLFRLRLLYKAPNCGSAITSFLKGAGFGVCLLPTAFASRKSDCPYESCGDLAVFQDMMMGVHSSFQFPEVADQEELPFQGTSVLSLFVWDEQTIWWVVLFCEKSHNLVKTC